MNAINEAGADAEAQARATIHTHTWSVRRSQTATRRFDTHAYAQTHLGKVFEEQLKLLAQHLHLHTERVKFLKGMRLCK